MNIVISILTFNKIECTKECLNSLFASPKFPSHKIVVSDNGSTDGTIEYLESLKEIHLVKNSENLGFSKAHNKIMKMYSDSDIVLMNNDIKVPFGWLSTLWHCVEKRKLGAASPAIKVSNGLNVGAILNERAMGRSLINDFMKPDWITGSCIYITRETINTIGMLDENFRFYYEDVDYCKRMKEAKINFECIRDIVIEHKDSASSTSSQKKQMMEESRKYFAKKWGYKE